MKEILILSAHMENFKRFHVQDIQFGKKTSIYAENFKGKSSVADLFSWVLFNKSSTGNTEGKQFRPRRYDENGVNIDHVDVVGEIVLSVDGEKIKIRKVQRQNWVRHKGDEYDSYMGDETFYEWNDAPVTPTNHKKKVAEIINEDIFRLISNPAAFPSMDAKKQREFLTDKIANITDEDVFATSPEYDLVKEAMGKGTLDELIARNKKEIEGYESRKKEIPVRIDQESKRIEDIDFSAKEAQLAKLKNDLADAEARLEDTGKAYEKKNALMAEAGRLKGELVLIETNIRNWRDIHIRNARAKMEEARMEFDRIHSKQMDVESALVIHGSHIEADRKELASLRDKYKAEMAKEMDENAFICPTCGQALPEDQADAIRKEFADKKAAAIKSITEKGNNISAEIAKREEQSKGYETQVAELKQQKIEAMGTQNKYAQELADLEQKPLDYSKSQEWQDVKAKVEKLEAEIDGISTADADSLREQIKAERAAIQEEINRVRESLALKMVIEKSKATVEELKEEMTNVVQSLANCEKLGCTIEKFKRAKMDMLSDRINNKFKVVKWKLFDKQKNGRYAEVCVCQIHGSDYGDNTTSATERMMAGMDIISTLQGIYGVEAPIFLDDADLYNDWNIPAMDCQLIKLCVSKDDELKVQVD